MWHEARKQERKIRCMMVDYKKRADRRRDFYEKIKLDPTQFLRVYGRPVKVHLDPAVALAAEGPQIMQPWQGNSDILIDRYDVRSHIDYIPEHKHNQDKPGKSVNILEEAEESKCCYERYRILVQNECAGVVEEQCLTQIYIDEQYGAIETAVGKKADEDKRKGADKKAAIGYTYEDSTPAATAAGGDDDDEDESSSDEEIDLDNILDIDMLTEEQEQVLNSLSVEYGMMGMDYSEFLQIDRDEVEALRQARQLEEEKAQYSGRKSRRERRAFKEKRMKNRPISPPSYAARELPQPNKIKALSSSRSRSKSPVAAGVVQFITSFGGDSDDEGVVHGPTIPPQLQKKLKSSRWQRSQDRSPTDRSSIEGKSIDKNRTSLSSLRRDTRSSSRPQSNRSRHSDRRSRDRTPRNGSRDRSRSRDRYRSSYRGRNGGDSRGRCSPEQIRRTWSGRQADYSRRDGSPRRSARRSRSNTRTSRRDSRSTDVRTRSNEVPRGGKSRSNERSRVRSPLKDSSKADQNRGRSRSASSSGSGSSSSTSSTSSLRSEPRLSTPPLKRYRRPSLSSSSGDLLSDADTETSTKNSNTADTRVESKLGSFGSKFDGSTSKLTPQERLKRRMQIALNKQYKADKRAQVEKLEKEEQMKQDREEEIRAIAVQMRQRERERRHREREEQERIDEEEEKERRERRHEDRHSHKRTRSRSKSKSTREKRNRSKSKSSSPPSSSRKPKLVDY